MSRRVAAAPLPWVSRRWQSEKAEKAEGAANEEEESKIKDLEALVAKLEKQLDEKIVEGNELKEKALYALAEADNARRIAKIDIEKARDFSVTAIAKDMLEVVDTLSRAVDAFAKLDKETEAKVGPILTGVKMSHQVLLHNLSRHHIEKMPVTKGAKFDPNLHEALFKAPASADAPADHIAACVKDGYTIKGRVLRAAQVGVAEEQ